MDKPTNITKLYANKDNITCNIHPFLSQKFASANMHR